MWIGFQIDATNLGSKAQKKILKSKLRQTKQLTGLNGLMIWAHSDPESIETINRVCADLNVETYLWFPVLADIPHYELRGYSKIENCFGHKSYGDICLWEGITKRALKGQTFEFICPNQEKTLDDIYKIYTDMLDAYNFHGVFLDRIRYPSAVMGFEMLYSCFCEMCHKKFFEDLAISLEEMRARAISWFENFKSLSFDVIKNEHNIIDILFPKDLKELMQFKKESVGRVVRKFSEYAKNKKKKVGLDLLSYSLSEIAAQDYGLLSTMCNWIKPMIYCHTLGPAGIPLELYTLIHSLLYLNPTFSTHELSSLFSNILQVRLPTDLGNLKSRGITEKLISVELKKMKEVNQKRDVRIYPGVEAMKLNSICIIKKDIIESYISELLRNDAEGVIFSWNLLEMPFDNLQYIGARLEGSTSKL